MQEPTLKNLQGTWERSLAVKQMKRERRSLVKMETERERRRWEGILLEEPFPLFFSLASAALVSLSTSFMESSGGSLLSFLLSEEGMREFFCFLN